jgi:hypothetical protein
LGLSGVSLGLLPNRVDVNVRRVVGVELHLVDGRCDLEPRVGEELLEVLDGKVGNTNVLDTARLGELLKLGPCVLEVPVGVMLAQVLGVGGGGPVLGKISIDGVDRF